MRINDYDSLSKWIFFLTIKFKVITVWNYNKLKER